MFEKELPEGYMEIAYIDELRFGFRHNIMVLLPGIVFIILGSILVNITFNKMILSILIFGIGIYPYFVLHEITHGIVYMIMTKQRVKIGFTKGGAYCALPELFVYRKVAVACTAAPLLVFSILLVILTVLFIFMGNWLFLPVSIMFSFHLFGCRADMNLLKEIHKVKEKDMLIKDMGTKQSLYLPRRPVQGEITCE